MNVFIALLRGINVSGHKPLQMDTLRKAFEKNGFGNVSTYVQSGNVAFTSAESNIAALEKKLHTLVHKEFGYDVPLIVLDSHTLKRIVEKNPFLKDKQKILSFSM